MTTNVDISSAPPVEIAPRRDAAPVATDAHSGSPWWRPAPVLLAGAIAVVYLVVQPRTVDLAAAVFRSRLFGDAGFTIWNNTWYSGHPTWSYSVLVPPLAWLLSPALLGALAGVVSAALFEPLARRHFGSQAARWGALWFGAAAMTPVLSGRITFACGVAAALAALLALQRGRPWLAAALAVVTGLMSPIAGLFLALAGAAYALAGLRGRGVALATAALAAPALVSIVFPDGREGPFVFSAFWPVPLFALAFYAALPARERTLRAGAILYALAALAAFAVTTPMGGNAVRLGALVGGPLLLCALLAAGRRLTLPLIALLVAFGVWQWSAAVRDIAQTAGDRSTEASFYRPLEDFLATRADGEPFRVEVPFTFSHWETAELSPRFALARGWLRPDDRDYNQLFYDGSLEPLSAAASAPAGRSGHDRTRAEVLAAEATYRGWLTEHAVRFVAVPTGIKPDYSARAELRLIAAGVPYLRPVWRSKDWSVYEFTGPHPMALGAQVTRVGVSDADLEFSRAGQATVRLRWSPYWRARGACVEKAGEWTRVTARAPGRLHLTQSFSIGRVLSKGPRCA